MTLRKRRSEYEDDFIAPVGDHLDNWNLRKNDTIETKPQYKSSIYRQIKRSGI